MNLTAFLQTYHQRSLSIHQDDGINVFVANALRFVIQNVFETLTSTYVIMISSRILPIEYWFYDIMERLFFTSDDMAMQMLMVNIKKKQKIQMTGRTYCNLVMVDSYEALVDTDLASRNANFDGVEYYFIFLQARDSSIAQEMERILQHCLDNYWLHCNVMTQTGNGEVLLHTYFPYTQEHCYQAKPQLINRFDGVKFPNVPLFPKKLLNLYSCPLRIDTWPQPPYVQVNYLENGSKNFTGLDINVLRGLSDDMNFTLDIKITEYMVVNENAKGQLQGVRDRETNMSLSYFRRSPVRDYFATSTVTTYHVDLVAVVIKSEHALASFRAFTYPYQRNVWICLICSLLLMVIVNHIKRNLRPIRTLQIFEILMGHSTTYRPHTISHRVQFLTWLWCSFTLRCVYQSLLFYLYSSDFYRDPPTSMEGLVKEGYTLICNKKSVQFLEDIPQIANNELPLIVLDSPDEMSQLIYLDEQNNDLYAAVIDKDMAYYFIAKEGHRNILEILPFNINGLQTTIYLPKHSFFVGAFNDHILRFFSCGFFRAWFIFSRDKAHVAFEQPTASMSNVSLIQIFVVWKISAFVYCTAFTIFIMELLSLKYAFFKKMFEFLN